MAALSVWLAAVLFTLVCSTAQAQSSWTSGQCGSGITLSNGNLTASLSSGSAWRSCFSSPTGYSSGKHYFEINVSAVDTTHGVMYGFMNAAGPLANYSGSDANSVGVQDVGSGDVYYNGTQHTGVAGSCAKSVAGPPFTVGFAVTVGVEFWCSTDGSAWSPSGSSPSTPGSGFNYAASISGAVYPSISLFGASASDTVTLNTTSGSFAHAAPSGFPAWDSPSCAKIGGLMLMNVGC